VSAVVTLYTRPGCHLCDQARQELLALPEAGGFQLVEVDIDTDDDLHARYLERIPVVEIDGVVVTELHVDADAIRAALSEPGTSTVRSPMRDRSTNPR
jgi:glutaredoxin